MNLSIRLIFRNQAKAPKINSSLIFMSSLVLFTCIQMKLNYPRERVEGQFQTHELMQMVR